MLQADMRGLTDVDNALTPKDRLMASPLQRCCLARALHTASMVQRLMARLPRNRQPSITDAVD
jgi:hypothetical protein